MAVPLIRASSKGSSVPLKIDCRLVESWLVEFLRYECVRRRSKKHAIIGLSGGVDSAVTAYLCAKAFGPENTHAYLLPYTVSSSESIEHAHLVVEELGIQSETIDVSAAVDGYLRTQDSEVSALRIGNICSRLRMTILFDQSARLNGLPIGTGNKTERFFGYFTWHGDDAPPVNPLGDLWKTQVWQLAKHLGVPTEIVTKPATADLVRGQTDEGDLGISYRVADPILHYLVQGYSQKMIVELGFRKADVELVMGKVNSTHWKRNPPTVAMLSNTSIGDYYLRPVDY